jgi:hypothetical protein
MSEGGTIFAFGGLPGLGHQGVIKSVDRGITWEAVEFPVSKHFVSLAFSPNYSEDKTLYVATRRGLFVSRNGGDDWDQLSGMLDLRPCTKVNRAKQPPDFVLPPGLTLWKIWAVKQCLMI